MTAPAWHLDAAELARLVPPARGVAAIATALRHGLDPEADPPRWVVPVARGEILLMPAHGVRYAGVKVATVAPGNSAAGLPRIQGGYLLFDGSTLAPIATMDAVELTRIRTAAVTAVAVLHLLGAGTTGERPRVGRLAVIGTGIQGHAHALTIAAVADVAEVILIGRSEAAAARLGERLEQDGLAARPGTRAELSDAGVVVCATSSSTPVLHGHEVADDAVIAAIGAHGPARAEIAPALVRRCDVVVESRASALAESGDLSVRPAREWARIGLTNLAELVTVGLARREGTPALYTGVGMSWQDLVIAECAFDLASKEGSPCSRT